MNRRERAAVELRPDLDRSKKGKELRELMMRTGGGTVESRVAAHGWQLRGGALRSRLGVCAAP